MDDFLYVFAKQDSKCSWSSFMSVLMIVASACMIGHSKSQSRVIDELLSLTISNYINARLKIYLLPQLIGVSGRKS